MYCWSKISWMKQIESWIVLLSLSPSAQICREQANPRPQRLKALSRSFKAADASWTCPKRRAVPM